MSICLSIVSGYECSSLLRSTFVSIFDYETSPGVVDNLLFNWLILGQCSHLKTHMTSIVNQLNGFFIKATLTLNEVSCTTTQTF